VELGLVLALSTLATAGISLGTLVALVLGVAAGASLLGNDRLSGGAKAMWLAAIVIFPILGSAVYFGVRSDW
jgi:Phospholipase_D-nuclease N-terminal